MLGPKKITNKSNIQNHTIRSAPYKTVWSKHIKCGTTEQATIEKTVSTHHTFFVIKQLLRGSDLD